jgi:hypothetical protein
MPVDSAFSTFFLNEKIDNSAINGAGKLNLANRRKCVSKSLRILESFPPFETDSHLTVNFGIISERNDTSSASGPTLYGSKRKPAIEQHNQMISAFVIASEARQSKVVQRDSGLLRRFASRNDGILVYSHVITSSAAAIRRQSHSKHEQAVAMSQLSRFFCHFRFQKAGHRSSSHFLPVLFG